MISIVGFGTLLSLDSAQGTCPSLSNFRQVLVPNMARVFNVVDVGRLFSNGPDIAALAAFCKPEHSMKSVAFDIEEHEWDAFLEREFGYVFEEVPCQKLNGEHTGTAFICLEGDNETIVQDCEKSPDVKEMYELSMAGYKGDLWRDDIFPSETYMSLCFTAAKDFHDRSYVDNILDESYLADKKTTLREYLTREKILTEWL